MSESRSPTSTVTYITVTGMPVSHGSTPDDATRLPPVEIRMKIKEIVYLGLCSVYLGIHD